MICMGIQGKDIPLVRLIPFRKRTAAASAIDKLKATIETVGLIEPLIVTPQDDENYVLLDGFLRYTVLLDLGVESAPCIIVNTQDGYTCNKQVCSLSKSQESKMLQAALSVIDERRIAAVFGRKQMKPRLSKEDVTKLHPEVIQEFDSGHLSKACVEEIKNVVPKRQKEILTEIRKTGNGTSNFVKSQVLQTPKPERTTDGKKVSPWSKRDKEKKSMVDKLKNVSKECDFFVSTYRRNVSDLTRTVIYVREMISIKKIEQFLKANYPDDLAFFKEILRHDSPSK